MSKNPFISALNALGILASGVLGALYGISRKEKIAYEETIESVRYTFASNMYFILEIWIFCEFNEDAF